jgi:triphosphatase
VDELELKFSLDDAQAVALRAELRRRGARSVTLLARYYDSDDGTLARHGVSLRLRKEGRAWRQTLKASGASAVHRLEHDVPLRVPAGGAVPTLDVARHAGSPAYAALQRALDEAGGADALVERFATDVARLRCHVELDGTAIEVALDRGSVHAGARSTPLCEVELELVAGAPSALFALAAEWRAHGGWWLDVRSKALRGTLLADGREHAPPVKATAPRFHQNAPDGGALVRAVLRSVLEQVLGNAAALAAGSRAEEHVHQLRVGLRRLRTALRELAPLAPPLADAALQAPLADAFAKLGVLRDDATVAQAVRPQLEAAHAPLLAWPAADVDADPGAIVRDDALQRALLALLALAHGDGGDAPPHDATRQHLRRRLSKLHRAVLDAPFDTLSIDAQHAVRKRLKRLRYLAEFVAPLHAGKAVQRYLKRLGAAQDALGRHNDVAVAAARFRAHAEHDARAWFAAGYLAAALRETARDAQAALVPLADTPRFWKKD